METLSKFNLFLVHFLLTIYISLLGWVVTTAFGEPYNLEDCSPLCLLSEQADNKKNKIMVAQKRKCFMTGVLS